MSHPLDGPQAKVERAKEHARVLNHEWRVFWEARANEESLDVGFDGTWYMISTSPPLKEFPPLRFSVICGDIVHNLRSALDHLVWQLVIVGRREPGKWNFFPIYTDSSDFMRDVKCRKRKRGPGPLEGINPKGSAWTFIEELQPYKRRELGMDPRAHQLAVLRRLSNTDKHQTLHVYMAFAGIESIESLVEWNPAAVLLEKRHGSLPISLEHETEVLRLRFSETGPDPQVQVRMNGAITFDPSFGDGKFQPTLALISTEILSFVNNIVKRSQRFFV